MTHETTTTPRRPLPPGTTHVAARPLVKNVNCSDEGGAAIVACDGCGQECWRRPGELQPIPAGYVYRCWKRSERPAQARTERRGRVGHGAGLSNHEELTMRYHCRFDFEDESNGRMIDADGPKGAAEAYAERWLQEEMRNSTKVEPEQIEIFAASIGIDFETDWRPDEQFWSVLAGEEVQQLADEWKVTVSEIDTLRTARPRGSMQGIVLIGPDTLGADGQHLA